MKLLVYTVSGSLYVDGYPVEVTAGDQVKIFLDQAANVDLPEFILGVVQNPIRTCGCETTYIIEYGEADLLGAATEINPDLVLSIETISCCDVVNALLDDEIAARIADVDAEEAARIADVNDEETARIAADLVLTNDLADEVSARLAADAAILAHTITGSGLATGGGALVDDPVITVTEASQPEAEAFVSSTTVLTPRRGKNLFDAAWSLAKAATQTISAVWTHSANVILAGTNNTAPNQAISGASSLLNAGLGMVVPPWLRTGDAWDTIEGGWMVNAPVAGSPWPSYFSLSMGPIISNGGAGTNPESQVVWYAVLKGPHFCSASNGTAWTGGQSIWFPALAGAPAGAWSGSPAYTKATAVLSVTVPARSLRAGRLYVLNAPPSYANAPDMSGGNTNSTHLTLESADDVLGLYRHNGVNYDARQTAAGAVAGVSGCTYAPFTLPTSGATDLLVRYTFTAATVTVELALYSLTPTWATVLTRPNAAGAIGAGVAVYSDGTASGASGGDTNSLAVQGRWIAFDH